ncbi:MAG: hypothetical protein WCC64_04000 [Aliidongia sp.]
MSIANISVGPFVKGALSYVIPQFRNPHVERGTADADFAYSQFLRFVILTARAQSWTRFPKVVAEIGPGSSFAFGICSLLAGADRYYALDVIDQATSNRNLTILDELVGRLKARAPLPATGWNARIFPFVPSNEFPTDLFPNLDDTLSDRRILEIRSSLANIGTGDMVRSFTPWTKYERAVDRLPDWIVSNSVMEHVDDLDHAYRAFQRWSAPGTIMSHLIDYSSHGIASEWNGHWAASDLSWAITRGRRHYLINRVPHAEHLKLHAAAGFKILMEDKLRRVDGLLREGFPVPFDTMSPEDASTHLAFVVSRYNERQ